MRLPAFCIIFLRTAYHKNVNECPIKGIEVHSFGYIFKALGQPVLRVEFHLIGQKLLSEKSSLI